MVIAESGIEMFDLDYKLNRMTCLDGLIGIHRLDSYIVHYAGYPSLGFVLNLIRLDLERWKKDAPAYKHEQRIHISVSGGIGDQLGAEPSLRFMKEKILTAGGVNVSCHWPRIYSHLPELGIKIFRHGEFRPEPAAPS